MASLRRSLASGLVVSAITATHASTTTVSILELGNSGAVRRVAGASSEATVAGVSSLWNSLHGSGTESGRRMMTAPGMSVVADLFTKPNAGIALGLNVEIDSMPNLSRFLDSSENVVDTVKISGSHGRELLGTVVSGETVTDAKTIGATLEAVSKDAVSSGSMVAVDMEVDDIVETDVEVVRMLKILEESASLSGRTVVVHVVAEDREATRRQLNERNLDEDEDEDEKEEEEAQDENQNNANNNYDNVNAEQNGYYGYGYYSESGEWVQVSKTIFQIQYSQIVLWTAIGLAFIVTWTNLKMMNMPLMADTLLFGESAKVMGE